MAILEAFDRRDGAEASSWVALNVSGPILDDDDDAVKVCLGTIPCANAKVAATARDDMDTFDGLIIAVFYKAFSFLKLPTLYFVREWMRFDCDIG